MVIKRKKGAALIIVLMVVVVMMILGATILDVGLAETKQAAHEDKRLQAHYLARSGAEATLKAWENATNSNKPTGNCETVYLTDSYQFQRLSTPPAKYIGRFNVTVTPPASPGADTVITSVGIVEGVTQTVTATIKTNTSTITNPAVPLWDAISGADLNWYTLPNGHITTDDDKKLTKLKGPNGKTVKLESGNKGFLQIQNKNTAVATFEAERMVFIDPVKTWHNRIVLITRVVAFDEECDYTNNGSLELRVLDNGVKVDSSGIAWGVVFFKDQGYYFKKTATGIILSETNDIADQITSGNLIKITDSRDSFFTNPYIESTTDTITNYSIIWK